MTLSSTGLFPELGDTADVSWMNDSNAATGWLMGSGDRTPDFLSSGWASVTQPSSWDFADALPMEVPSLPRPGVVAAKTQRRIKIDVDLMIGELIKRGICLGRAPGFRRKDVDLALRNSIIQIG